MLSWAYGRSAERARTASWSDGQHLEQGWLRARLPSYFIIRKSELRRERVSLRRRADGGLEAVNGLGTDLESLWVADGAGRLYTAGPLQAGAAASLERSDEVSEAGPGRLRELYNSDLPSRLQRLQQEPEYYLRPGTYIAVARASPFIEAGLDGLDREALKAVIYGISDAGGDL